MAVIKRRWGQWLVIVEGRILFRPASFERASELCKIINDHQVVIA